MSSNCYRLSAIVFVFFFLKLSLSAIDSPTYKSIEKYIDTLTVNDKAQCEVKGYVIWFFDQWVHGSDIPVYHFAFKTEKTPDDKFTVHVRVEQKEVPPDFKMSVPIKIVFENGSIARIRVFITGAKSEFDLPPLVSAPKEIIFNDLESVLATVKVEDWE